ncbi:DUF3784 domain-containing protein [Sutcliffiella rhizosphaerae]|uniref:Bacterial Pleckstrin homology domain-containing protein n=1 Tax=Sutcliffiella rhizosphaerae TaxID=2880967 RepID=A0ABN8ACG1_9BACI|nr:DUF3784 domain-containing protein [Sutcliffiella rhizosphaerae]CAG9621737.1 hypothetical protein BACCIP111883_02510 [Sutcliffiella rhizosphaerae]
MWILLSVQLFLIAIFILLGWAISKKKAYNLISNFATRPKEEQEELIKRGYTQKTGKLLITTGIVLLLLLPLLFFPISYALEINIMAMIVLLLGGFIYLSKYEIPKKRKKSYIISTSITLITVIFLSVVFFLGYQDFELKTHDTSFEITGVYGDEWTYEELTAITLLDSMPEVTFRTNGYGLQDISKGHFALKEYGSSLLFIHKGISPYLLIQTEEDTILINSKNAEITEGWYNHLEKQIINGD